MPDSIVTPGQQDTPPAQPASAPSVPTTPEGFIEKPRFDGAIRKIEELTLKQREQEAQLAQKASELEQLKAQLGIKDVEVTAAVGERDKKIEATLLELQTAQSELGKLKAMERKLKVIKEMGRPELVKIIDRIPDVGDEAVLKEVIGDFASFADGLVQQREQQLLAGYTPPTIVSQPSYPNTQGEWLKHINSLELGSIERQEAVGAYGDFLEAQAKQQR